MTYCWLREKIGKWNLDLLLIRLCKVVEIMLITTDAAADDACEGMQPSHGNVCVLNLFAALHLNWANDHHHIRCQSYISLQAHLDLIWRLTCVVRWRRWSLSLMQWERAWQMSGSQSRTDRLERLCRPRRAVKCLIQCARTWFECWAVRRPSRSDVAFLNAVQDFNARVESVVIFLSKAVGFLRFSKIPLI